METVDLHKQKIQILGRLIKESSLTLEEALLLLQPVEEEEEETKVETTTPQPVQWLPSIGSGGYVPLNGTITTSLWPSATTTNLNYPNITVTNTSALVADLEKAIDNANL